MELHAKNSRKVEGDECEKWGYRFVWTDQHIPPEHMNVLRFEYDQLGAAALERLQKLRENQKECPDTKASTASNRSHKDLYTLLRDNYQNDDILTEFWNETHKVPEWASSGVAEILIRTGGFSTRVLLHRLFETFQWVLQCTQSITSIQPGGVGHTSTIRVRLLHASVRQRILKLTSARPDYYDANRYGIPINALDSIHSISLFCASPMWQQLPRQGIRPRADETADYVALFRYLGYLSATPPEYFASPSRAKATMESLLYYEVNPSATGKVLGNNFVECLRDVSPMNISKEFIEAGSRWMNGDEVCDALGMGRLGLYYSTLMVGHCMLNWGLCWAQRMVPALDRWVIATSRAGMNDFVIHGDILKRPSNFDFKHIPRDGKKTQAERGTQAQSIDRWIERYYFYSFVAGCAIILGGVYVLGRVLLLTGVKAGAVLAASFVERS
ncbi:MAG: hypothetical protein Q9191_001840 [Dirinaria sp. TL-2023a]